MNLLQFKKRTVVTCERCGQELTDPESIARGTGPECAMKQSEQFAAISNLSEAIAIGDYFDMVARKFFQERDILEARLSAAKREFNPAAIVKLTKRLQRVRGILVRREMQRQERLQRKAVA